MLAIEILLLLYFGYVSLYAFAFSLAALFFKPPGAAASALKRRFAVLIPSYREDNVIIEVALEALRQNYPAEHFRIVVIADSMQPSTLRELRALPITVIEVSFEKSTKVRSLNRAFAELQDPFDLAVILDADNVMERDFLEKMNNLAGLGYRAIQCERTSKNDTNSMSVLDGLSERINNFIYRQGHVAMGLSCSLIGSGMVFEFSTVKDILSRLDSIGGFDRELELELIRRRIPIQYGKGILVFDEKVENTEVFEKQRTRWLSSQFVYLRKYFKEGVTAFFRGDLNMFNSAILRNIQLPRVINLGLLVILLGLALVLRQHLRFDLFPWATFLLMNIIAIVLAIPSRYYNAQMFRSFFLLPRIFVRMFNLLFKLKGANKSFIHTPHGVRDAFDDKKVNP
jgi:cellulose synthase/poly-beta-1,6-N-acetylglucosamine synthase-like glycosyltransferase